MDIRVFLIIALSFRTLIVSPEEVHEDTAENHLYTYLFHTGYNKHIRPIEDPNQAMNVTVRFELSQIRKIDDKEQVLYTSGFFAAKWFDAYLTWEPANFSNAEHFIIDANTVWLPDFALINSVEHIYDSTYKNDFKVHIYHTGRALFTCTGRTLYFALYIFCFDYLLIDLPFDRPTN